MSNELTAVVTSKCQSFLRPQVSGLNVFHLASNPRPRLDVNLLAAHESDAIRTDAFAPQSRNSDRSPRPVYDLH